MNIHEIPRPSVVAARNTLSVLLIAGIAQGYIAPNFDTDSAFNPEKQISLSIQTSESWLSQSPLERINALENGITPPIETEAFQELVRATAEFYCEQTTCNLDPEELASRVVESDSDWFNNQFQKTQMSAPERVPTDLTAIEFFQKDVAHINRETLHQVVEKQKHLYKVPEGKDIHTIAEKSLLLHVFAHMTASDEIRPINYTISFQDDYSIVLDTYDGFDLRGEDNNGNPIVLNGGEEAVVELAARTVGEETGTYITLSDAYGSAASVLNIINRRVGISSKEFLEFHSGNRSIDEMFHRWNTHQDSDSTNAGNALGQFINVGLLAESQIPFDFVLKSVDDFLNMSN